MHRYTWLPVVAALILAAVVGGIAYNYGLAQGLHQSGKVVMPPPGPGPYAYPYPYWGWHPWGFGFFFGPLFFFILFFVLLRGLFWRGRWHHGYCGSVRPPTGDVHSDR